MKYRLQFGLMPKMILIMGFLSLFSQPVIPDSFRTLICEYDAATINMYIAKADLIKGFKRIDKLECADALEISSYWFTIIRDNKSLAPLIIQIKDRKSIPKFLKSIKVGDHVAFTMLCHVNGMQRRDKVLTIMEQG